MTTAIHSRPGAGTTTCLRMGRLSLRKGEGRVRVRFKNNWIWQVRELPRAVGNPSPQSSPLASRGEANKSDAGHEDVLTLHSICEYENWQKKTPPSGWPDQVKMLGGVPPLPQKSDTIQSDVVFENNLSETCSDDCSGPSPSSSSSSSSSPLSKPARGATDGKSFCFSLS